MYISLIWYSTIYGKSNNILFSFGYFSFDRHIYTHRNIYIVGCIRNITMGTKYTAQGKINWLKSIIAHANKNQIRLNYEAICFNFILAHNSTRRTFQDLLKGFEAMEKIKIENKEILPRNIFTKGVVSDEV